MEDFGRDDWLQRCNRFDHSLRSKYSRIFFSVFSCSYLKNLEKNDKVNSNFYDALCSCRCFYVCVCAQLGTMQPWAAHNDEIPDTWSSPWNTATFSLRPIINNKKRNLEVRGIWKRVLFGLSSLSSTPLCCQPFQTSETLKSKRSTTMEIW